MLHRGLAHDREERFPDVTAFVTALEAALGPALGGPGGHRAPGCRSTPTSPSPDRGRLRRPGGDTPVSTAATGRPRRRGRAVLVASSWACSDSALGVAGGYVAERQQDARGPDAQRRQRDALA